jgi:8-oxo-dGTP pyrophosphatase MutT (NUDIX family)
VNNLTEKHVVTCFLESEDKILILRRSDKVGSYRGKWAGVSGYAEGNPDTQALVEINEETGLGAEDVRLVKKGGSLQIEDAELSTRWIVHPYLYQVLNPDKIKTDWEHTEFRWITPETLKDYDTVPGLEKTLGRVK